MKKIIILCCFFLLSFSMIAQKSIHNYKYIIVSKNFQFLRAADQYQTSSLTKFLFNKNGYIAYLDTDKIPSDFNNNRCLALFVDVKDVSKFLSTNLIIELKDCNNNVVYTSKLGRSKEKEFKDAYHEAIRKAFEDIRALNYTYTPVSTVEKPVVTVASKPKVVKKIIKLEAVVEAKSIPVLNTIKTKAAVVKEKTVATNAFHAESNQFGYTLINSATSTIEFTILKTNLVGVFIVKENNGILYKKKKSWFMEFYTNNERVQKQLQIKF